MAVPPSIPARPTLDIPPLIPNKSLINCGACFAKKNNPNAITINTNTPSTNPVEDVYIPCCLISSTKKITKYIIANLINKSKYVDIKAFSQLPKAPLFS